MNATYQICDHLKRKRISVWHSHRGTPYVGRHMLLHLPETYAGWRYPKLSLNLSENGRTTGKGGR